MPEAMVEDTAGGAQSRAGADIVLGFDFGLRRIGVAVGNTLTGTARPLEVIAAGEQARWRRIGELLAAWQPARLVVGVARHPDGTAHDMTARCERFARQLEGRFRLPAVRVDERYSSAVVPAGRDDEAAAVIVRQWLDSSETVNESSARPDCASAALAAPLRTGPPFDANSGRLRRFLHGLADD